MLSALMTIGNWRYRSTYYYYSSAERCFMFFSHERPTLETLDVAFYIGSFIGNVLYFDLYLNTAYAPCTCTTFMTGMIWFIFKPVVPCYLHLKVT